MLIQNLTVTEYTQEYYDEHKDAGLDYLGHGYWQEEYAKMVTEACKTPSRGLVIDAGCACGSILKGFAKLNYPVLGIDLNQSMIDMGKKHFGYSDDEIKACSISNLPLDNESVDLVHNAQVAEHLPPAEIDGILKELYRVTKTGGKWFICLDAIKEGENKEMYLGDPTHLSIEPTLFWSKKFADLGMIFDRESYDRFVKSPYRPEKDGVNFFNHYPYWSTWILVKV